MKVWGVSDVAWKAIQELFKSDIKIADYREFGKKVIYRQFTLQPKSEYYRKVNPVTGRKANAVCWHGYTAFMRVIFELSPNARIVAGRETKLVYKNAEHFKETYLNSDVRQGSSFFGTYYYSEACAGNHPWYE